MTPSSLLPPPRNENKNKNSDAGAEAAQRKALALRCREWEESIFSAAEEGVGEDASAADEAESGSSEPPVSVVSSSGGSDHPSKVVAAAKRAALPCLRNLASFVSNQGRHADAEVVLVSESVHSCSSAVQCSMYLLAFSYAVVIALLFLSNSRATTR